MTRPVRSADLPFVLLAATTALLEQINAGVVRRGYEDVRPLHGFVFARIAGAGATVGEVASHLGVTKQSAAQTVEELVVKGYVERRAHPGDGRARLVVLTRRGRACTKAAGAAAEEVARAWSEVVGSRRLGQLGDDLSALAAGSPPRPAW